MNKEAKHLDHMDRCANISRKKQGKFDFLAMLIEYFLIHGPLIFSQKTQSLSQVLIKTVIPCIQFNTQGVEKFFDQEFALLRSVETLVSQRKSSLSLNRSRCIFQRYPSMIVI